MLRLQPVGPVPGPGELHFAVGRRPFRKRQKIRGMGELRAGEGAVRRQLLQPVLADRFEHGVARLPARSCLLLQEARVDQRGNPLQDVDPHRAGNGLGGLHGEATNEDGEPVEEDCSSAGSRPWLHAMASRIVCCRAGRSRPPPVSNGNRVSNLASSAAGGAP